MTPICTRVTPESLPGLLERLENETSVMWWGDGEEIEAELPTHWTPSLNIFRTGTATLHFNITGMLDIQHWCEDANFVTPNEFVRLVAAACGKDVME